jgi:ubiquinone/menaquinone biosynthesis C-methylase UbiE
VCADFSKEALLQAKSKLGDKGVYVLADVTKLPIASDSMDAVTCNHVLYHIAPDDQPKAFKELWRVLKPGGVAAIVYAWSYSPLARRIDKLAERIMPRNPASSEQSANLPFFPQSLDWFSSQPWPFKYSIRPFRVVGNGFLRQYVGDNLRSRVMLALLWNLQRALPAFVGRYGQHPAILISK